MSEETTPAAQVPAEVAHRAVLQAREEVDQGCHLAMTSDNGMVALVLPDRLLELPATPALELRLAAIAQQFSPPRESAETALLLATTARRALGARLRGRVARRTEPERTPRVRPARSAVATGLRPFPRQ